MLPWLLLLPRPPHPTSPSGFPCCPEVSVARLRSVVLITLSRLTFTLLCLDFLICKIGMTTITEVQGSKCSNASKVPRTPAWHIGSAPEIQAVALIFTSAPRSPPTVLLGGWKDCVSSRLQASVAGKSRLFLAALGNSNSSGHWCGLPW